MPRKAQTISPRGGRVLEGLGPCVRVADRLALDPRNATREGKAMLKTGLVCPRWFDRVAVVEQATRERVSMVLPGVRILLVGEGRPWSAEVTE